MVFECKQVKNELENPRIAWMRFKETVEDLLPQRKKILNVVDHEIPKCKNE